MPKSSTSPTSSSSSPKNAKANASTKPHAVNDDGRRPLPKNGEKKEPGVVYEDGSYIPIVDKELIGFMRYAGDVYDDGDKAADTDPSDLDSADDDQLNRDSDSLVSFDEDKEKAKLDEEKELLSENEFDKRTKEIEDRREKFEHKEIKRVPIRTVLDEKFGFTEDFQRHAAGYLTRHPASKFYKKIKDEPIRAHKRFDQADLRITKNKHGPCKGQDWSWQELNTFVKGEIRRKNHKPKLKPKRLVSSDWLEEMMVDEVLQDAADVTRKANESDDERSKDQHAALWAEKNPKKKMHMKMPLEDSYLKNKEDTKEEALRVKLEERAEFARMLKEGYTQDITNEEKQALMTKARFAIQDKYAERGYEEIKAEEDKKAKARAEHVETKVYSRMELRAKEKAKKSALFG
ncbi:unnamed protein product [Amoebophrya sp. A120]|nr:unnamed protein product [Amoebophrya sp. A120]|eukprot:GSA120T00015997001.1